MSMREARSRLPGDFVQRTYESFPLPVAEKILAGCLGGRVVTLRVNTLKTNVREVMAELWREGIKVDRVLWYGDALMIKDKRESDLEPLALYKEGAIYLQSLSSMIPPLVLEPKPGEHILDIAAAPGSKTTQIAALMGNTGRILANEVDQLRTERLKFNLDRQGVQNTEVRMGDGGVIGKQMPQEFDRVLVDAPCSGEGLFLVDQPATYRHWTRKMVAKLTTVQKRLLRSGLLALKPGGVLVYSTCTLGFEENELVLDDVLAEWQDEITVAPIDLPVHDVLSGVTQVGDRKLRSDISRAWRILPTKSMEGFFVAKLVKRR